MLLTALWARLRGSFPRAFPVLLGLAVVAGLAISVWALTTRAERASKEAATSRTEAIVAQSQTAAAQDAVRIVVERDGAVQTITHRTEVTTREILAAPGASDQIDPALHLAGLRALCLHDNRRDATCADVLQSAPQRDEPAPADPARSATR